MGHAANFFRSTVKWTCFVLAVFFLVVGLLFTFSTFYVLGFFFLFGSFGNFVGFLALKRLQRANLPLNRPEKLWDAWLKTRENPEDWR